MKFTMTTQEFNYLINKCLTTISAKPAIPILSNLLIEAANGRLTVTATDLTVGVRCSVEASISEEGATTLPAKKLSQLVRELTATNMEFKTNSSHITEISADSSRFRLHGMDRADFPALPDLDGATHFTLKQAELRDILYRTSFAVSREDNRFVLMGVFLKISNGVATFVGTDGKRMARSFMPVNLDPSFSGQWVIPLKAIEEAQKNLMSEGEATLYLMDDKIAIQTADTTIITKLLAGEYPDVERIIPPSIDKVVTLHREELIALLRQVSLFSGETNHSARFAFSNGELNLAANSMESGEGKTSMPANYQGDGLDIAFNPIFFLDILRHSTGETVSLGITDAFTPGVISDQEISPVAAAGVSPLFILMPLRLNEQ
ncbi:MAG: DNA polymerase III subunit beta [Parachlamydiaceae bacterium]